MSTRATEIRIDELAHPLTVVGLKVPIVGRWIRDPLRTLAAVSDPRRRRGVRYWSATDWPEAAR